MFKNLKIPEKKIKNLIEDLAIIKKNEIIIEIEKLKISRIKLYNDILIKQKFLLGLNLKKNDTIISLLDNSYNQITLFLASICLGLTWIPLGRDRKGVGLEYILSLAKPKFIFTDKKKLKDIPNKYKTRAIDCNIDLQIPSKKNKIKKVKFLNKIKTILFTSGTTGPPKGVIVNGEMLIASAFATGLASKTTNKDKFLLWESLHHIGGIEVLILCLQKYCKIVLLKKFSAKKFWPQIIKNKITIIHYLGGILDILIKQPKNYNDKKHKVKLAFGAGARKSTYKIFKDRFNIPLREVYGMTEASSFTSINIQQKIGSIGRVLPWFKVILFKKKSGVGEILIKTKYQDLITKGYYKDKKSTSKLLKNKILYTGDLGKFDKNKNLYYMGRKKDAVRVKGENISAWEIETTLNNDINISESAIISTAGEIGEDDIIALLILEKKVGINVIANKLQKVFSKNYHPRYWAILDEFPRTPTYRIDKKLINIDKIKLYDFVKKKFVKMSRNN